MDFIQQLQVWAKGDALQGKIMLGIGIVLAIGLIFILRSDQPMLRGMLIPIGLLLIANLGYGGFLTFSRPSHIQSTIELYNQNPVQAVNKELAKAETDHKSYSTLKPIWVVLIVVAIVLYFVLSGAYYKGLSIGLAGMFLGTLLIDGFLHQRLKPYLEVLRELGIN